MSRVLPYNAKQWEIPLLLDGRRTVARRVIKPRYQKNEYGFEVAINETTGQGFVNAVDDEGFMCREILPTYQPGDILYVRETWCNANKNGVEPDYYYYADVSICEDYDRTEWKWRPSIHMPKEAARIWLKVTDVRVERLQDITFEDCLNEGAFVYMAADGLFNRDLVEPEAKRKFCGIWDSTIKRSDLDRYGWEANPWVWVIEFKLCEKPESEGKENERQVP